MIKDIQLNEIKSTTTITTTNKTIFYSNYTKLENLDGHILNYRLGLSTNRVVFEVHYQRGIIQRGISQ